MFDSPAQPPNTARFAFLDPRAPDFYRDWEKTADDIVAILHAEAGRNPYDRGLTDLVGELSTRSEEFRSRWAAHNVRFHRTGAKRLHHPLVGDLDLTYEAMELAADAGQTLLVYTAEPATPTAAAVRNTSSQIGPSGSCWRNVATESRCLTWPCSRTDDSPMVAARAHSGTFLRLAEASIVVLAARAVEIGGVRCQVRGATISHLTGYPRALLIRPEPPDRLMLPSKRRSSSIGPCSYSTCPAALTYSLAVNSGAPSP